MPTRIRRLHALYTKVETTEGTDAVPGAADALQLLEAGTIEPAAEFLNDRPDMLIHGILDEAGPTPPGAKFYRVRGRVALRGRGSAYDGTTGVPEIHALLQGAGFSATFGAGAWTYDTVSSAFKTLTIHGFHGLDTGVWVRHVLLAARIERLTAILRAGRPGELEFTALGLYNEPTDASPTTPTYLTSVAPNFGAASSWALGALTTAVVREARVELETPLSRRLSGNAADGLLGFMQERRRGTFSARFEAARVADYNALNKWSTAAHEALAIDVGSAGTNRYHIDADKAVILEAPTYEDESGIWLHGVSGKLSPEGATNRVKWLFD